MTLLHQAAQKAVEALTSIADFDQWNWSDRETVRQMKVIARAALESAALQHQEVPREPVATLRVTLEYDDEDGPLEIVCHGTELNMRRLDARLKFLHRLEKQSNDCAASPSTTRQQEVGSEPPGCEGCNCAACELRRKHEAAAPSTPEKAGGVSDGVGQR